MNHRRKLHDKRKRQIGSVDRRADDGDVDDETDSAESALNFVSNPAKDLPFLLLFLDLRIHLFHVACAFLSRFFCDTFLDVWLELRVRAERSKLTFFTTLGGRFEVEQFGLDHLLNLSRRHLGNDLLAFGIRVLDVPTDRIFRGQLLGRFHRDIGRGHRDGRKFDFGLFAIRSCGHSPLRGDTFSSGNEAERLVFKSQVIEILDQFLAGCITMVFVLLNHLVDDEIELLWDFSIVLAGVVVLPGFFRHDQLHDGVPTERQLAGDEVVKRDTKSINVSAAVSVLGVAGLFRRHVQRGSKSCSALSHRHVFVIDYFGETEVSNLHDSLLRHQDVIRLDIAVDHVEIMSRSQRIGAA